jgi:hypothetical protein
MDFQCPNLAHRRHVWPASLGPLFGKEGTWLLARISDDRRSMQADGYSSLMATLY